MAQEKYNIKENVDNIGGILFLVLNIRYLGCFFAYFDLVAILVADQKIAASSGGGSTGGALAVTFQPASGERRQWWCCR